MKIKCLLLTALPLAFTTIIRKKWVSGERNRSWIFIEMAKLKMEKGITS